MLRIVGLKKKYGERIILDDINLKFEDRGLYFITGDSGCGKTTFLNILGLFDAEYEGDIYYDELKVDKKDETSLNLIRKEKIGYVFQDYNLIDYLTVYDNLKLSCEIQGESIAEETIRDILKKLKLEKISESIVANISGGEKQRVAMGRSILKGCRVLFADEPTGNLDKDNTKIVLDILKNISKDILVVVVTHNEKAAFEYGDYVLKFEDEKIEKVNNNPVKNGDDNAKFYSKRENKGHNNKKKSSLDTVSLNKKFLKNNRKKNPVIIMTTFCIIMLGFLGSMFYTYKNLSDIVNHSILESDKYIIKREQIGRASKPIDNEFIEKIGKNSNVKKCIPYYSELVNIKHKNLKESLYLNYNIVDYSEFFDGRFKDLRGEMPQKENEIIVDDNLAKLIFDDNDCIGQTLQIETNGEIEYECKIVGIRSNEEELDKVLYLTKELADRISEELIKSPTQDYEYVKLRDGDTSNTISLKVVNEDSQEILYGRPIRKENEVLISDSSINEYLENMRMDIEYSDQDIKNKKIDDAVINRIFEKKIYLTGTGEIRLEKVSVVGIFKDNEVANSITIGVEEGLINSLSENHYNIVDIYVDSSLEKDMKDINGIAKKNGYTVSPANGKLGTSIYIKVSSMMLIISAIMMVVIIVSLIVIYYSNKNMMIDRIREMGIMKSLGADGKIIRKIFVSQGILIWVISSVISFAIMIILSISKIIKYNGVPLFVMNKYSMLLSIMGGLAIVLFIAVIESAKISKKSVINCLKS